MHVAQRWTDMMCVLLAVKQETTENKKNRAELKTMSNVKFAEPRVRGEIV